MRISYSLLLLIAVVVGGHCSCETPRPRETAAVEDADRFAGTIRQIGNEVESLSVPDELFASNTFVAIYEHPEAYSAAAAKLMSHRDVSAHQKKIIGYAMQRLSLDPFLALLHGTMDSVEQGATDVEVLESTTFPPLNWGKQSLIMHHEDPRVQALLVRLMNMKQLPEHRRGYVKSNVLTGRAKIDYFSYMDMLGRRVPQEE